MQALLCKQFGPPESLVVEDTPAPTPGPKQVLIRVEAAGVNFPDTLIIQNKYQYKPELPFSPGGEFAGVVESVGSEVNSYNAGDRVIAFTAWGAFAELVVADAIELIPMPDGLDFVTASAFLMTYGTSYYALKSRADIQPGETLLVLGASGGVGLAAIELGKAMGARVIAAASTAAKLEICRQHGADELINYVNDDLRTRLKEITGSKGVDVVYDPVGGPYTEASLRSCAWGGRVLIVGFANGEIPAIPANLALLKGASIVGVFWGGRIKREPEDNVTDLNELFDLLQQGKLHPHVSATYPLERGAEAIRELMDRRVSGKVVILPKPLD